MFSKSKLNAPIDTQEPETQRPVSPGSVFGTSSPVSPPMNASAPAPASSAVARRSVTSLISADLTIRGDLVAEGDVQIEGVIEGDIRSGMVTVGETAVIRGEIVADDVVVNGRVIGRIRGNKVRLSNSAHVQGDILHKSIAIEAGAHFEGSVQRAENPLGDQEVRQIPGPHHQG
ncbi:polymer-forming cytoskeletal protein [Neomegalonema sp.]|uniref:bactofilin family protein n=1 Tax=Neomegalonema sp. TaxID=2039713 RepID=UPI002626D080|nr:polymer-forming cytoskeletal protein [Neomegalonema sp.]MDD2867655.1 polymer-forming cytoskeletal protein [Neomegalonema sp.]